jgi:hypothetical protein
MKASDADRHTWKACEKLFPERDWPTLDSGHECTRCGWFVAGDSIGYRSYTTSLFRAPDGTPDDEEPVRVYVKINVMGSPTRISKFMSCGEYVVWQVLNS